MAHSDRNDDPAPDRTPDQVIDWSAVDPRPAAPPPAQAHSANAAPAPTERKPREGSPTSPAQEASDAARPVSVRKPRRFRRTVFGLASFLAVGAFIQATLGGLGVLGDLSTALDYHRGFVHLLEFVPIVLAVFAFIGRDWLAGAVGVVLFFLIGFQYALIRLSGAPRGLHVANGLLVFALALVVATLRAPRPRRAPSAGA